MVAGFSCLRVLGIGCMNLIGNPPGEERHMTVDAESTQVEARQGGTIVNLLVSYGGLPPIRPFLTII